MILDVIVTIPRLPCAMPELHKTHTALDQAAGHETLAREISRPIHIADVLGFTRDIEGIGGIGLHAIGKLEAPNARLELRIVLLLPQVLLVHLTQEIELFRLPCIAHLRVAKIFDHVLHLLNRGIEISTLEAARQKRRAPIFRAFDRHATRAKRYVGGEIFVFAAEAIGDPRAHGRSRQSAFATVHQHQRWLMVRHICRHRADHTKIVCMLSRMGKKFTHF